MYELIMSRVPVSHTNMRYNVDYIYMSCSYSCSQSVNSSVVVYSYEWYWQLLYGELRTVCR